MLPVTNDLTLGVFTVKNFYSYKNRYFTYGGFGHYIKDFAQYFKKVLLFAHVTNGNPPKGFYEVNVNNLEIVSLPVINREWEILYKFPGYFHQARKHIKKLDLVQARMPDYTGIVGSLLAKKYKIPKYHVIIADWSLEAKRTSYYKNFGMGTFLKLYYFLYDFWEQKLSKNEILLTQGLSCYQKHSQHAKECHLIISSAHQKNDIISNPVEKFNSKPYTILNVGRLNRVKNQKLIIRALKILINKSPEWRFIHVGEGPKRSELERLVKNLNLDKSVTFLGRLPHGKKLWEQFDNADVFVLSSLSEGTPKVILEAQARGVPVVATDIPGVRTSIQHGENGLTFDSENIESLIYSIQQIQSDHKLRQQIIHKGLEIARKNTLEFRNKEMLSIVSRAFPHLNIYDPLNKA